MASKSSKREIWKWADARIPFWPLASVSGSLPLLRFIVTPRVRKLQTAHGLPCRPGTPCLPSSLPDSQVKGAVGVSQYNEGK